MKVINNIIEFIERHYYTVGCILTGVAAFLYFYTIQFVTPFMMGEDSYYHIKFAYLTRVNGIIKSFPWAQFSLWKDHFYDKEFLYHYILQPFTFGDLTYGGKLAAVFMGTALFVTLFYVLKANRIKYPLFWIAVTFCTTSFFLYRISITRPQTISILLSLVMVHLLLNKKYYFLILGAFIYSLAHTGAYVSLIYAVIIVLVGYFDDKKFDWKLIVFTAAGLLVGMVVHPNFPNNFVGWYIQNVNVLTTAWSGSNDRLGIAGELKPINTRVFVYSSLPLLIPYFIALYLVFKRKVVVSQKTLMLFAIASAYLFAFLNSLRFCEMWTPFSIWFLASFYTDAQKEFDLKEWVLKNKILFAVLLATFISAYSSFYLTSYNNLYRDFRNNPNVTLNMDATWVKHNIPDGSLVYTCDWDDAPYLFFGNDKARYLVFLDPHFMHDWDKNIWEIWYRTSNGRMSDPYSSLKNVFKADYVYCTSDFKALIEQMKKDKRFKEVHKSSAAVIFEVLD
ncbi:MAG: hypothetical protein V1647_04685 [Pseudomonadota bacterium]